MDVPRWGWAGKVGWGFLFVNVAHGFIASLFLAIAASGVISGEQKDSPEGKTWEELKAENPWLPTYMNQWLRFLGIAWLGMSIFGLAINLRPFRQEIPWAWIVLWVYPLYQLYQASDFLFREGVLFGLLFHIALAVLGIAGLAMTAPRFFGAGRPNVQPQA